MLVRLALFLLFQPLLLMAQTPLPESFRIGELRGNSWFITDVQPVSQTETLARFIRVYPSCGTFHVDEDEYVFENLSVSQLAPKAALCLREPRVSNFIALSRNRAADAPSGYDQIIAARCGSDLVIHRLPPRPSVRLDALHNVAPQVAALFTLAETIATRYSKEADRALFACNCDRAEARAQKRAALEQAATAVRSGDYDLALPDVPPDLRKDGQPKLSLSMPPPEEAADWLEHDSGEVENLEQLGLEHFSEVQYPQLARVAHIEGEVKVELSVDPASGKVVSVLPSSGHPILRQSVIDTAKQWVFPHPYFGPNPSGVLVKFKIRCPMIIETSQATIAPKKRIRKRRTKKAGKSN